MQWRPLPNLPNDLGLHALRDGAVIFQKHDPTRGAIFQDHDPTRFHNHDPTLEWVFSGS